MRRGCERSVIADKETVNIAGRLEAERRTASKRYHHVLSSACHISKAHDERSDETMDTLTRFVL